MRDLERQLELMDAFLARADATPVSRPAIASALRRHVHAIAKIRLSTGYSPELNQADVALTAAISRFQFGFEDGTLESVRDRLQDFHGAVLSPAYAHAPLPSLAEFARERERSGAPHL